MWILYAAASAFFAGITAVLAKCGIRKTNSTVATAVRTTVVLAFAWLIAAVGGSFEGIGDISLKTLAFLILSGLATGASWLCYFRALSMGNVSKVISVDKFSVVIAIVLSISFLHEGITPIKAAAVALITLGTALMLEKRDVKTRGGDGKFGWFIYAALSAVFAALTAVLGKIGISDIDANLGTAIRTTVVLVMAWSMVFISGKQNDVGRIDRREMVFICLSGLATGVSWLCYYRALQNGNASAVVSVDKLSMLVTIAFSYFVFRERLTRRAAVGVTVITLGTIILAVL